MSEQMSEELEYLLRSYRRRCPCYSLPLSQRCPDCTVADDLLPPLKINRRDDDGGNSMQGSPAK